MHKSKLITTLIIGIIILGVLLRLYKFDIIPFGLNHDGAQDALQAIDLIQQKSFKVYLPGGSGETLFKYYLGVFIGILGSSIKTIRLASTIISIITIPLFYLFVKELTGKRIAIFSTFLFSISGWHIILGRSVWRAISTPFFEIITLYFLIKALRESKKIDFLLMGIFLGLSLYTYNSARVIPIFVTGILIFYFLRLIYLRKKIKPSLFVSILAGLILFIFTIAPLILYARNNWPEFNSRLNSLSVLQQIRQQNSLIPLFNNIVTAGLIFNVRANGNDFFINQPLLDFPFTLLFIIGIYTCIRKIKEPIYLFTVFGLIIMSLPGIVSVPNGNRNITTIPFVYLISGIGLNVLYHWLIRFFKGKRIIALTAIIILCLMGLVQTYRLYFGPHRHDVWGFYPETTVVGNLIKKNLDQYDFYLTDNYPRDALTFITYSRGRSFC